MADELMRNYQQRRAERDEWEHLEEEIREGRGRYADMAPKVRENALKLIEGVIRTLSAGD